MTSPSVPPLSYDHLARSQLSPIWNSPNESQGLDVCMCASCPTEWRIKSLATILKTTHSCCSPQDPLTIVSVGSGQLGMEHALMIALQKLGYQQVHFLLVDPIYQGLGLSVRSQNGKLVLSPKEPPPQPYPIHGSLATSQKYRKAHDALNTFKKKMPNQVSADFSSSVSQAVEKLLRRSPKGNFMTLLFGLSPNLLAKEHQLGLPHCDYQVMKKLFHCLAFQQKHCHSLVFEAHKKSDFGNKSTSRLREE